MEVLSGIQEGLLALPKGGGAAKSIGERFQPDIFRGSGNYAIPIEVPKGPNALQPKLQLRYSTGDGNGPFGMGWVLSGPLKILRRTDKGLPKYEGEDEFIFGPGEVLVPVGDGQYRPRTDRQFMEITHNSNSWTVRTKQGYTYHLGSVDDSRLHVEGKTFGWLVDREIDPAGNEIRYHYQRNENQLYLERVSWSIYEVHLSYESRPDSIHFGRAGFPITSNWRCVAIERHCLTLSPSLTSRYALHYRQDETTQYSLLTSVELMGFDASGNVESYPPVQMTYSTFEPTEGTLHRIEALGSPPPDLNRPDTSLVDMDGDGLPDVLQASSSGHRYWKNQGSGSFGPMKSLDLQAVGMNLGDAGVSFADLTGDGTADLLRANHRLGIAVANTGAGKWAEEPLIYDWQVPLDLSHRTTRMTDLNGDGVIDLIQSGPAGFTLFYNQGDRGWSAPQSWHAGVIRPYSQISHLPKRIYSWWI